MDAMYEYSHWDGRRLCVWMHRERRTVRDTPLFAFCLGKELQEATKGWTAANQVMMPQPW
jgi:hypothetical protein